MTENCHAEEPEVTHFLRELFLKWKFPDHNISILGMLFTASRGTVSAVSCNLGGLSDRNILLRYTPPVMALCLDSIHVVLPPTPIANKN